MHCIDEDHCFTATSSVLILLYGHVLFSVGLRIESL